MPTWHSTNGSKRNSENKEKTKDTKKRSPAFWRPFLVYTQMLKNTLNTKISTLKVFNLDLFPYLCGLYSTILERKSQSVFHLTSGYNIGR